MARKKKRHLGPSRKRMTPPRRLSSARATRWVEEYKGKNIIAGYANWFAVDPLCALIELRLLGVKIDAARENQIKASIEARAAARNRRKELRAEAQAHELHPSSDGNFAYIAGYTPGGAPYGVSWEELEEASLWCDDEDEEIEQTTSPEAAGGGARSAAPFGGRSADVAQPSQRMIAANRAWVTSMVLETVARHVGVRSSELDSGTHLTKELQVDPNLLYRILVDIERQLGIHLLDGDWYFDGGSVDALVDYYMRRV